MREILPRFSKGRAVIGVCGAPYKCPPAPNECALMLHDLLTTGACAINARSRWCWRCSRKARWFGL